MSKTRNVRKTADGGTIEFGDIAGGHGSHARRLRNNVGTVIELQGPNIAQLIDAGAASTDEARGNAGAVGTRGQIIVGDDD